MKSLINLILAVLIFSGQSFAGEINAQFFNEADAFFKTYVKNGNVNYAVVNNDGTLKSLIQSVSEADLSSASDATIQAFYINAYNLHVINKAANAYPLSSVMDINGFFDSKKITVGGKKITLNQLEKDYLLKPYGDARYHFVLVCGALGCPPITNFAYTPEMLEQQLEMQTQKAINDSNFLKVTESSVSLSQIFKWYAKDFGGNKKAVLEFINKYRSEKISSGAKVKYYDYDWKLNDTANSTSFIGGAAAAGNNSARYIVSSTIKKGSTETKIFNNLYTQHTGSAEGLTDRSTFNTTSVSFLYGLTNRINVGFSTRYRQVRNDRLPSNVLSVFSRSEGEDISHRQGFTAFGPQIRFAPVPKWTNFSIQSSFVFAIGDDLEGSNTQPYIDWSGPTWWTQFFNDFSIGNSFSLFTEIDFLIEDIGSEDLNRISTPVTLIFSYNPTSKITLYTLGGYSPYWQADYDYFSQVGVGSKYQFTPNLELELLYTDFSNKFLNETGGQAATYNLGLRFNI